MWTRNTDLNVLASSSCKGLKTSKQPMSTSHCLHFQLASWLCEGVAGTGLTSDLQHLPVSPEYICPSWPISSLQSGPTKCRVRQRCAQSKLKRHVEESLLSPLPWPKDTWENQSDAPEFWYQALLCLVPTINPQTLSRTWTKHISKTKPDYLSSDKAMESTHKHLICLNSIPKESWFK
jgi:hypothetical protein